MYINETVYTLQFAYNLAITGKQNTSYKRTAANYIIPKCIIADVGDLVETKTLANQTISLFDSTRCFYRLTKLIMFFVNKVAFVCKNKGSPPHTAYALALLYK